MPELRVNQVLETAPPFTPQGKNYTVREWRVNGSIDGGTATELLVKTLSGKAQCQVIPGWVGYVEKDEHAGVIKWKIPTPKPGGFGQAPAQASQAQPQQQARQEYQANGGYTFDEMAKLFTQCFEHVAKMVPPDMPAEALSSLTATLFIGVRDSGIRLNTQTPPAAQPQPQATTPPAPDMDTQIAAALSEAGILDAVKAAKLTRRVLHEAWVGSASELEFTQKVLDALPKPAPVAEEDLPF